MSPACNRFSARQRFSTALLLGGMFCLASVSAYATSRAGTADALTIESILSGQHEYNPGSYEAWRQPQLMPSRFSGGIAQQLEL